MSCFIIKLDAFRLIILIPADKPEFSLIIIIYLVISSLMISSQGTPFFLLDYITFMLQ
jgi:hypothetical protein